MEKICCICLYRKHAAAIELANVLRSLRPGDTLVVPRLERLAISLPDLIQIVEHKLQPRDIGLESLAEHIDTRILGGVLLEVAKYIVGYQRIWLAERTHEGLRMARPRGGKVGRPAMYTESDFETVKAALEDRDVTIGDIAKAAGLGRATLYRRINVAKLRRDS